MESVAQPRKRIKIPLARFGTIGTCVEARFGHEKQTACFVFFPFASADALFFAFRPSAKREERKTREKFGAHAAAIHSTNPVVAPLLRDVRVIVFVWRNHNDRHQRHHWQQEHQHRYYGHHHHHHHAHSLTHSLPRNRLNEALNVP